MNATLEFVDYIRLRVAYVWHRMALTAMTLDDTVVVPPVPDPFDCSIPKRKWNKVMPPRIKQRCMSLCVCARSSHTMTLHACPSQGSVRMETRHQSHRQQYRRPVAGGSGCEAQADRRHRKSWCRLRGRTTHTPHVCPCMSPLAYPIPSISSLILIRGQSIL